MSRLDRGVAVRGRSLVRALLLSGQALALLLGLCALLGLPGSAQAAGRRVELLVFDPGEDVFERYGHAALRVIGPGSGPESDRVFNFGITDWTKPNYIRDFLTGRVKFWGNVRPFARTQAQYEKWDRTVNRYPLDLTDAEVDGLVARMEHDVLPEHREYVYDTFRDNCATRLRDYLDTATGGAVRRSLADEPPGPSYRADVRVAFAGFPPLLLLTEIVPGVPLDAPRTTWERMYRPAVLGEALTRVWVERGGERRPLTPGPILVRARTGPPPLTGWPDLGQAVLFGLATLMLGGAAALRSAGPRARRAAALAWLLPSLVMALVLAVVALGTIWPDMQENWLLLALPVTDFALVPAVLRAGRGQAPRHPRALRMYLALRAASVLLLAGLGPVVPALIGPLPPRLCCLGGLALLAVALFGEAPAARPEVADVG